MVDKDACSHNAKVKMTDFKDRYERTKCHKFIVYDASLPMMSKPY
ncbi:hypothetical protein NITUZ_40231 [Candidatus Nitrosotenuis uzonensis]|uniref:Uncharacterized protein n=1 Tax=Candidatus Nitrosotenuis uzonensis TaxID=1407055 RepID=V6AU53_9ARCH|nr:hypothetical protein NITUZ_40231 [Candidatus Nitrosotenuis uzonensis]